MKRNNTSNTIDILSNITSTGAALFNNLGENTHGIVNTTNANGFIEQVQTIKNYDMLEKGTQLNAKTKGLLVASIGLGIVDAAIVDAKNPEDSKAGVKRLTRNMITVGATYLISSWVGTMGAEGGAIVGAGIGSAIEPVGGTAVGGAFGATAGYTAGSIVGAVLTTKACDYIFGEKLNW